MPPDPRRRPAIRCLHVAPFLVGALIVVSPTVLAQTDLTVQILPGGDREQLAATLKLLAEVTQPELHVPDGDVALEDVVRERCGTATEELVDLFRSFDPRLAVGVLTAGRAVPVPACPRWLFDKTVTVQPGWTAWDIAMRYLGSGGPRALAQLSEVNHGMDLSKLQPDQAIRVPYVSLPVTFRLRYEYKDRPSDVVDRFEALRTNGVGGARVLHVDVRSPVRMIEPLSATGEPSEAPGEREAAPPPPPAPPPSPSAPPREPAPPLPGDEVGHQEASERGVSVESGTLVPATVAEPEAGEPLPEVVPEVQLTLRSLPVEPASADQTPIRREEPLSLPPPESELQPVVQVATVCPEGLDRPDWPFDAERLARVLDANRRRSGLPLTPAVVAILDTGIERAATGIEDLAERHRLTALPNPRFAFAYSVRELRGWRDRDDDKNACLDDIIGTNLATLRGFPEADPEYGLGDHGIHVAGLVHGGFTSEELRRLARERIQLKIFNIVKKDVRVDLAAGTHRTEFRIDRAGLTNGLLFAEDVAHIANYSVDAGGTLDQSFENNFNSCRNLLLVVAAGNEKDDLDREPRHPMALGGPSSARVIVVAAHDPGGALLARSNYGPSYVDLAAPGCALVSGTFGGSLKPMDGTSQAAPLVSFTAGLLHAEGLTSPASLKSRIMRTVDADVALEGKVSSAGRLNVEKALSVYDDWVATLVDGERRVVKGQITRPRTLTVCGHEFAVRDLEQVVLDYDPAGQRAVRLTRFDRRGRMSYVYCDARPTGSLEVRTEDGPSTIDLARVVEIVPSELAGQP